MKDPNGSLREAIKCAIKYKGISMREVSRLSGWSASDMSRYLAGKKDAQGETIFRVLKVLGINMELNIRI